jgi:hypothetical protein
MRSRGGRGWPGERSWPEGAGSEESGSGWNDMWCRNLRYILISLWYAYLQSETLTWLALE